MTPFIRTINKQTSSDLSHEQREHEVRLRMTPGHRTQAVNDHAPPSSPYSTVKSDNEIRNLSFFKEQERHFTEPADEEEWHERQSPINFVLVTTVLIVTAVAGWFCFRWLNPTQSNQPPIISAEQEVIKVKPENPGGMVIPHQDKLIYNRLTPEQQQQPVERLLPPPEQPIAVQGYAPAPYVDQNGQVIYPEYQQPAPQNYQQPYPTPQQGQPVYPQSPQGAYPQQPQQPVPQGAVGYPAPNYSNQQPMLQEQQPQQHPQPYGYAQQTLPQPAPIPAQEQPLEQSLPQRNLPAPLPPLPTQSLAAQPQAQQPQEPPAAPDLDKAALDDLIAQETEVAPAKVAPVTKTEPTTGKYRVQVATFNNEKEAVAEANRLKKLDALLFKDRAVQVTKTTNTQSKKTLYRVVVSGFGTANQAAQFSSKLRVHKIKGIVLNPTNG